MSQESYLPSYRDNNLADFIGELRYLLDKSQVDVAVRFQVDRSRISRYENNKLEDKPDVGYVADLARLVVQKEDNDPEVQQRMLREVNKAVKNRYGHSPFQNWAVLCHTADTYLAKQQGKNSNGTWQSSLEKRLDLPPAVPLMGVAQHLERLSEVLLAPRAPWIICIDGLGGIGKTSLVNALIRQPKIPNQFQELAWVSAKQQYYQPNSGIEKVADPVIHIDTLTDALLKQLDGDTPGLTSLEQKQVRLVELLNQAPFLVVIDNLETTLKYETLLPFLLKLANPAKFLLTSRHSLRGHPHIFSFNLTELSYPDAADLIKQEIDVRGLSNQVVLTEKQIDDLYNVIGGNPLALQLVVGQISAWSVSEVVEILRQAQGQTIEELYTYIYWQAWHTLDINSQKVFLMLPVAPEGTLEILTYLSRLERSEVRQALRQLIQLSLVQVGGNLEQHRYTIHRLTETFLLNEAVRWIQSA